MSYTEVTKGNFRGLGAGSINTKNPELQPNYSVEYDGYGLITGRATFTCTASAAKARTPKRGDVFPGTEKRLYCHRASYTINGNKLATITAEYVGIEDGKSTKMTISGDASLGSEPIQTHPDFVKKLGTAEYGWDTQSNSYPNVANAKKYNMVGIKSYLKLCIQITGTIYTSDKSLLTKYIASVGRTITNLTQGDVSMYLGSVKSDNANNVEGGLVTGCSHEEYGNIYKIKISLRINPDCWNKNIYKSASK